MTTETRIESWERRAEWPLLAAALVFLVAYAWPILVPDLPADTRDVLRTAAWAAWALFVVDYVVRLGLAPDRGRFVVHNISTSSWWSCLYCVRYAYCGWSPSYTS